MLRYTTDRVRPGLVTFYDIRPGNGVGLFLQPRNLHEARLAEKDTLYLCCYDAKTETVVDLVEGHSNYFWLLSTISIHSCCCFDGFQILKHRIIHKICHCCKSTVMLTPQHPLG